jgi:hypothetical protein
MKERKGKQRLALLCDSAGVILRVVQNQTEMPLAEGQSLEEIVETSWRNTAQRFMTLLPERHMVWGWRIRFQFGGHTLALHIAGIQKEDGYILLGAGSLSDLLSVFASLVQDDMSAHESYPAADVPSLPTPLRETGRIMEEFMRLNNELTNAHRELAKKNAELEEALGKIKTLSGLVTICASCKKIRDDHGNWNQLEHYIQQHSDTRFTHGFCPECMDELYGKWIGKPREGPAAEPASVPSSARKIGRT